MKINANLTDEQKRQIAEFIRENIQLNNMSIREIEEEAMKRVWKFGVDARSFLEELEDDLRLSFSKVIKGEVDK